MRMTAWKLLQSLDKFALSEGLSEKSDFKKIKKNLPGLPLHNVKLWKMKPDFLQPNTALMVVLRLCSFRGYINPIHIHPLSPTSSLIFLLLSTLKQKYHSFPFSPTPCPPFPHSFIQLPSSFNSFQLLPTFTHSFPSFPHLKKTQLLSTLTHFFPLFSHSPIPHPKFPT